MDQLTENVSKFTPKKFYEIGPKLERPGRNENFSQGIPKGEVSLYL
jgi:hypothetical protein